MKIAKYVYHLDLLLQSLRNCHLPDSHPSTDDTYKSFSEVFGKDTTEQYRPSIKAKSHKEKTLPFYPSVQHVRYDEMMLLCKECEMWRLIYAKRKLKSAERQQLELSLDYRSFSCGALQDIPAHLKEHSLCSTNIV